MDWSNPPSVVLVAKDRSASPAAVENQDAVGRKASAAFAFRSSSAAWQASTTLVAIAIRSIR